MNEDQIARDVRVYLFTQAAATARIPQAAEIALGVHRPEADVRAAIERLAQGKALILAPNGGDIWAANPFCAVPSGFAVLARGLKYWAICIWDALGIAAALDTDATIHASCGDCGTAMSLELRGGALARAEGVVHFALPAKRWWENIGFT